LNLWTHSGKWIKSKIPIQVHILHLVQNLNTKLPSYLKVLSLDEIVEIQWLALEFYKTGKAEYQFQGLTRPIEGHKLTSMLNFQMKRICLRARLGLSFTILLNLTLSRTNYERNTQLLVFFTPVHPRTDIDR
jgi:hypothetical protein